VASPPHQQRVKGLEKGTTVSEEALPKTWREAVPYVVWVVFVLGFGLEFVTALVHGEWLHVIVSFVGLVSLMTAALHWNQFRSWAQQTNSNWVWGSLALLLLTLVMAPFVEERRWPFSTVFHDPPTAGDIAKATAPIQTELDRAESNLVAMVKSRDALQRQNDALHQNFQASDLPKSPILGLDDAKRYQLIKALRDATHGANNAVPCHAMVHSKPNSKWAVDVWPELSDVMTYASWAIEGGRTPKTYFPVGITLSSAEDTGTGFNCAFRLSELLVGMNLPTTLRDKQVTPDLIACEKENPSHGCVEIVVGDAH
jgi:hypothetical protein